MGGMSGHEDPRRFGTRRLSRSAGTKRRPVASPTCGKVNRPRWSAASTRGRGHNAGADERRHAAIRNGSPSSSLIGGAGVLQRVGFGIAPNTGIAQSEHSHRRRNNLDTGGGELVY